MSKFLTVGQLLEQLKDAQHDYEIMISGEGWSNCHKEISVSEYDEKVYIYDYC